MSVYREIMNSTFVPKTSPATPQELKILRLPEFQIVTSTTRFGQAIRLARSVIEDSVAIARYDRSRQLEPTMDEHYCRLIRIFRKAADVRVQRIDSEDQHQQVTPSILTTAQKIIANIDWNDVLYVPCIYETTEVNGNTFAARVGIDTYESLSGSTGRPTFGKIHTGSSQDTLTVRNVPVNPDYL